MSVHFVRHKIGIEHFVSTQRSDRTGNDRNLLTQAALVSHECIADAQSIINISRKRLCNKASEETRIAWRVFLKKLKDREPELFSVAVPECIYRGFCPELNSCGYTKSEAFFQQLNKYRTI